MEDLTKIEAIITLVVWFIFVFGFAFVVTKSHIEKRNRNNRPPAVRVPLDGSILHESEVQYIKVEDEIRKLKEL